MDGFIFFLIFIFIVIPIIKNIFGGAKSDKKKPRSKANQWGQSHAQIKNQPANPVSTNRGNDHKQTSFQTHQRTQDQKMRGKERDDRQREAHRRLASLQNRERGDDIVRIGNKGRDDWGVRGDNSGVGGMITVIILGVITFFALSYFAPTLMDMLNNF